jgi:sugar lactone lactonase YvrE/cell division protein FtsB
MSERPYARKTGQNLLKMALGASVFASTACQSPENTGTAAKAPGAADSANAVALSAESGAAAAMGTEPSRLSRRVQHAITRTTVKQPVGIYGGAAAGLALDANDNLYIAENWINNTYTQAKVTKVTPSGQISDMMTGLNGVTGVAVDASGNLYASEGLGYLAPGWGVTPGNRIKKRTPDGQISTFVASIGNPTGLAFDAAGNLFAASWTDNAVYKFSPSGVALGQVASGFDVRPYSLTFDASGNLYVGAAVGSGPNPGDWARSGKKIYKVTPGGAMSVFYEAPAGEPGGLAFDSEGHLWASMYNARTLVRVAPNGSAVIHNAFTAFGTTNDTANGIAIDRQGNIYALMNTNKVIKIANLAPAPPPVKDCSKEVGEALGAADAQIAQLQASNAALSGQVSDLQAGNSALTAQVSDLQAANSALTAQVSDLQAANAALTAQVANLQAANSALSAQVAQEQAARATIQAQLDATTGTIAMIVSSIQGDFRNTFRDAGFAIPGATPMVQLQNLINATLGLEKGRKMGIYQNLGGKNK